MRKISLLEIDSLISCEKEDKREILPLNVKNYWLCKSGIIENSKDGLYLNYSNEKPNIRLVLPLKEYNFKKMRKIWG